MTTLLDSPSTSLTDIRSNWGLERAACIWAWVEYVFAHQKSKMGLFIRTIGLMRAEAKITLTNFAYNMNRLLFLALIDGERLSRLMIEHGDRAWGGCAVQPGAGVQAAG